MGEGFKKQTQEEGPKVIKTEVEFRYFYADSRSQFWAIEQDFKKILTDGNFSFYDLKKNEEERTKGHPYLKLTDYLKQHKNVVLSTEIEKDFGFIIRVHDDLIEKIKKFSSMDDLENILEDVRDDVREDFPDIR